MTTSPFDTFRPPEPERRRGGRRRRRAGGRGEEVLVPEAEFSSYYGRPVVKAAPWEADIPAYLFLGGLAAGSGLLGTGASVTGRPVLQRNSRYAAMAAIALSGAALVHDLGRPERFLNMLRTVKLTSPMSVGTWIFSGFSATTAAATAAQLARAVTGDSRLTRALAPLQAPAGVGSALLAPPLAAYTAVLLSDTATPSWNAAWRELPFVFVGSAQAAAGGMAMVTTPTSQVGPARVLAALGAALDVGAMELLHRRLREEGVDEPLEQGRPGAMLRASTALTVAGGVGAALFSRNRAVAAASGAALVVGSALTRFGIFEAGIASTEDPKYVVEPQRRRLEARRAAGRDGDSITTGPHHPDR